MKRKGNEREKVVDGDGNKGPRGSWSDRSVPGTETSGKKEDEVIHLPLTLALSPKGSGWVEGAKFGQRLLSP